MKYFLAMLLLNSTSVYASEIVDTKITELHSNLNFPGLLFLQVNPKPALKPVCSTSNNYEYVLDISTDTGKAMYSLMVTAYVSGRNVNITGYDRCNLKDGYEDFKAVSAK